MVLWHPLFFLFCAQLLEPMANQFLFLNNFLKTKPNTMSTVGQHQLALFSPHFAREKTYT